MRTQPPEESPSLRALRGGRVGRAPRARRVPIYADIRHGPTGYVQGGDVTAEFLWAWVYDPAYPAAYVSARWAGRGSDPPPPPGSVVILADNRCWCLAAGPAPAAIRARVLGGMAMLQDVARIAVRMWDQPPGGGP